MNSFVNCNPNSTITDRHVLLTLARMGISPSKVEQIEFEPRNRNGILKPTPILLYLMDEDNITRPFLYHGAANSIEPNCGMTASRGQLCLTYRSDTGRRTAQIASGRTLAFASKDDLGYFPSEFAYSLDKTPMEW